MSASENVIPDAVNNFEWNDSMDPATVEMMYEETTSSGSFMATWADAVDAKVIAIFSVASLLIGAIPAIGGIKASGWEWTPWIVAAFGWFGAGWFCIGAFRTRSFRVGPDPSKLLNEAWTHLTPDAYRSYRVRDLAKDWLSNWEAINAKAEAMAWAIPMVAIEATALVVALMLQAR